MYQGVSAKEIPLQLVLYPDIPPGRLDPRAPIVFKKGRFELRRQWAASGSVDCAVRELSSPHGWRGLGVLIEHGTTKTTATAQRASHDLLHLSHNLRLLERARVRTELRLQLRLNRFVPGTHQISRVSHIVGITAQPSGKVSRCVLPAPLACKQPVVGVPAKKRSAL